MQSTTPVTFSPNFAGLISYGAGVSVAIRGDASDLVFQRRWNQAQGSAVSRRSEDSGKFLPDRRDVLALLQTVANVAIINPAGTASPGCARRLRSRVAAQGFLVSLFLLAVSVVAAAPEANAPREYLDDETGATVTFVGRPLVFARQHAAQGWFTNPQQNYMTPAPRDYVTLAAAAVNRGGKYSYVLIGYFWVVGARGSLEKACIGREHLVLELSDRRIELAPCDGSARDAGISQQVHRPSLADAKPGVYPTDLATLGLIAESADPVLHCAAETTPLKVRIARGSTSSA